MWRPRTLPAQCKNTGSASNEHWLPKGFISLYGSELRDRILKSASDIRFLAATASYLYLCTVARGRNAASSNLLRLAANCKSIWTAVWERIRVPTQRKLRLFLFWRVVHHTLHMPRRTSSSIKALSSSSCRSFMSCAMFHSNSPRWTSSWGRSCVTTSERSCPWNLKTYLSNVWSLRQ